MYDSEGIFFVIAFLFAIIISKMQASVPSSYKGSSVYHQTNVIIFNSYAVFETFRVLFTV